MIFSDTEYLKHSKNTSWKDCYISRRSYWPDTTETKNSYQAISDTWGIENESNFWFIGEQYYSLAWSLYTLGYREQLNIPYNGNVACPGDIKHQELLKDRIFRNGWGFIQILGNSHLACELAFKSITLHSASSILKAQYPKTHDLEKIFNSLPNSIKLDFENEFNDWASQKSANEKLKNIIHKSGEHFLEHRYNQPDILNSNTLGTLGLSRFIYEVIFDA